MLKRRRCYLTRIGFGLNIALMIMQSIMNLVISKDTAIRATSSYIDDVFVNTHLTSPGKGTPSKIWTGLQDSRAASRRRMIARPTHSNRWTRGVDTPDSLPVMTWCPSFQCVEYFVIFPFADSSTCRLHKTLCNKVITCWDDETNPLSSGVC